MKGENKMNEQLMFWSVIMMNGFFILAFIGHVIRTIVLKKPILEKNILMYIAIIISAMLFNLICLDKIGKEKAEILLSSIAGVVFGALGNILVNRRDN